LKSLPGSLLIILKPRKEAESGSPLISARTCGTKLFLDFERFPEIFGVYGGTFDEPNWFERSLHLSRHIFLDAAQNGTVIPAGFSTFRQHAMLNDGTPVEPVTFGQPRTIGEPSP
jgi:hypothetical protein